MQSFTPVAMVLGFHAIIGLMAYLSVKRVIENRTESTLEFRKGFGIYWPAYFLPASMVDFLVLYYTGGNMIMAKTFALVIGHLVLFFVYYRMKNR